MLGLVPTWGNIVMYVTSYLRIFDPSITMSSTFLVFPMTLSIGALSMQLGSVMLDYVHPKLHLFAGGFIYCTAIALSAYMHDFYLFLFFYAILAGVGYGIIYMLPLKNAWLYFPNKKGMVGGIILASHSFAAIGWSFFTSSLINPDNEIPSLYINKGNSLEIMFAPDSAPAQNVKYMLNIVSYIMFGIFFVAVVCMNKPKTVPFEKQLAEELLSKGIVNEGGVNHSNAIRR